MTSEPTSLPVGRECPFDPPAELKSLRAEPVRPLRYPDGHVGWLVTGYQAGRAVLSDRRFSSRSELHHLPVAGLRLPGAGARKLPGSFILMDPPDHTRLRRSLTAQFTARRMNLLKPKITEITHRQLDAMQASGPPTDLVASFALPIPSRVISELLGVPHSEQERFHRNAHTFFDLRATDEQKLEAQQDLAGYLADLVRTKRSDPADDLLSGLVAEGKLADDELVGVSLLLLVAGHDTTANMLALGTFALLSHAEQAEAIRAEPELIDGAVEELLRYLTILHLGTLRTALEDVEVDGQLIKAGQTVTVSLPAANRDPERYPDPDRLEVTRNAGGHLAFGHGIHQCLGQQLARIELRIGFPALLDRFPNLRLAADPAEIPLREDMAIYGVHELPVTW